MGKDLAFEVLVKKRNPAYKDQIGPFLDVDALISREVVSSDDAFSSRLSFRSISRSAFDAARNSLLEGKPPSSIENDKSNA